MEGEESLDVNAIAPFQNDKSEFVMFGEATHNDIVLPLFNCHVQRDQRSIVSTAAALCRSEGDSSSSMSESVDWGGRGNDSSPSPPLGGDGIGVAAAVVKG